MQYASRCLVKTSPLSAFTPVYVGSWSHSSTATTAELSFSSTLNNRTEFKTGLMHSVIDHLLTEFEFAVTRFPLRLNGSVGVKGRRCFISFEPPAGTPCRGVSGERWRRALKCPRRSLCSSSCMRCSSSRRKQRRWLICWRRCKRWLHSWSMTKCSDCCRNCIKWNSFCRMRKRTPKLISGLGRADLSEGWLAARSGGNGICCVDSQRSVRVRCCRS